MSLGKSPSILGRVIRDADPFLFEDRTGLFEDDVEPVPVYITPPPFWRRMKDIAKESFKPKPGALGRQAVRTILAAHGVGQRMGKLKRLMRIKKKEEEYLGERKLTPAERKEYIKLVAKKSPWPGKKELIKGGVYMAPVPIPGAGLPIAVGLKHADLMKQAKRNVRRKRSMSRTGKVGALVALGLIAKGMKQRRKKKKKDEED